MATHLLGPVVALFAFLLLPSVAFAFALNPEPPGQRITMTLNVGSTPFTALDGVTTTFNQLAESAVAEWNRVGVGFLEDHNFFTFRVDPSVSPLCSPDGVNVVAFRSTKCGMEWGDLIGVTTRWIVGGKTVQADVLFNSNKIWNSYRGPLIPGVRDFQRVALHEFGHVAGLSHEDSAPSIMTTRVSDIDRLQLDDIAGVRSVLFPATVNFAAPLPPRANFITGFYREVLGRTPDIAGLAGWVGFLSANCNAQGFDAIAQGFFDSLEFRTVKPQTLSGLVTLLYRTFLGRAPDPGGLAGWADLIRQARLTIALRGFIPSVEFQSLLPDRTNRTAVTALVTLLYQQILQREPEPQGLAGWVDFIVATRDLERAAVGFLASIEFETRALTARDYVTILYRTFLEREPDPAGLDGWETILRDTLLQVINAGFVPSQEFQGLVPQVCG